MQDINNALTVGDCNTAINLSTQLYNSQYSDNDIRMLYASSQGCNIGIQLPTLITELSSADFSSVDSIFKSLVRIFPSRTALDSRFQSAEYAQDALQAMLNPGAVIAASDTIYPGSYNPGSVWTRDRTDDSNDYLVFLSMAAIGTGLNRWGFNASDNPAALGYAKTLSLPWTTWQTIQSDRTTNGCGIASALLNMFDAITALSASGGSTAATLENITTEMEAGIDAAGALNCTNDGFSATDCNNAVIRLRFRNSCLESEPIASVAAGIIQAINAGWL